MRDLARPRWTVAKARQRGELGFGWRRRRDRCELGGYLRSSSRGARARLVHGEWRDARLDRDHVARHARRDRGQLLLDAAPTTGRPLAGALAHRTLTEPGLQQQHVAADFAQSSRISPLALIPWAANWSITATASKLRILRITTSSSKLSTKYDRSRSFGKMSRLLLDGQHSTNHRRGPYRKHAVGIPSRALAVRPSVTRSAAAGVLTG
jgi:hypothetical protein